MLMVRCAEHGAQKQRCFYYHSHANTLHYEQAPLTQVHRPVRGNTDGRVKASSKMLAVRENYPTSRGGTFFEGGTYVPWAREIRPRLNFPPSSLWLSHALATSAKAKSDMLL